MSTENNPVSHEEITNLRTALREAVEMIEFHCDEGFIAPRESYPDLAKWRALLPEKETL